MGNYAIKLTICCAMFLWKNSSLVLIQTWFGTTTRNNTGPTYWHADAIKCQRVICGTKTIGCRQFKLLELRDFIWILSRFEPIFGKIKMVMPKKQASIPLEIIYIMFPFQIPLQMRIKVLVPLAIQCLYLSKPTQNVQLRIICHWIIISRVILQ